MRHIPGIGMSVPPPLLDASGPWKHILISESDMVRTCREIAHRYGLLVGGSTGSVLAAVRSMRGSIPKGATVVAISPDLGQKYLMSVYDDHWVTTNLGVSAAPLGEGTLWK